MNVGLSILKILQGWLRRIQININQEINRSLVEKGNTWDISIIKNVISQRKTKMGNTNVNVGQKSWRVGLVSHGPGKSKPVRVVRNTVITEVQVLGLKTTLVLSNTRELNRELFTK